MFKLLPEEEKKKVAEEYAVRRAVIIVEAFILVLVVGLVGLFPSYILSSARKNEVTERVKIMGDLTAKEGEGDPQKWLRNISLKLNMLSPSANPAQPSVSIKRVLDERGSGVRLMGFSWLEDGENIALTVSGVSQTRQLLLSFEDRLNASGYFSEVALPVSNLARDRDIAFQLKLIPTPKP